uniref:Ion transport domain-containing protein n=1 Tax=Glossina austeni TaxID=7395 RepID=A0A1A9USM7_GLOAU
MIICVYSIFVMVFALLLTHPHPHPHQSDILRDEDELPYVCFDVTLTLWLFHVFTSMRVILKNHIGVPFQRFFLTLMQTTDYGDLEVSQCMNEIFFIKPVVLTDG